MKKILYLLFVLFASFSLRCGAQETKQPVVFSPQYIIEGSKDNTVIYDPSNTVLANETDIRCVMFFYGNDSWVASDIDMRQKEGKWIGTFEAPQDASLLVCKFVSGDAVNAPASVKTDWGWPATYANFILDKEKHNKPSARIGWALLRMAGSPCSVPGILSDSAAVPIKGEVGLMWFNNEFAQFPQSQPKHFSQLVWVLNQVKPGEKNEQLKQNVAMFLKDKKLMLTDQQWADIYDVCLRTLNDSAMAKEVRAKESALYKHGIIERDDEIKRIQELFAKDWHQGMKDFARFMKTYPSERFINAHSFITDLFYGKFFRAPMYTPIMKKNDYSYVQKYIHDVPYQELVATHWHVVEIPVRNNQIPLETAYKQSVIILDEIATRTREDAGMMQLSPREFEECRITNFRMALFAHARLCTALGKYDEAMKYANMVYSQYKATDTEFATMWIKLLQENGRGDEVVAYVKECVFNNQVSQEMIDILKSDYLKNNPKGDFDKYMASMQNKSEQEAERQKILATLKDEPINLNYVLDMLGGGKVDLSKKQGKIMFLDFWATWCAPCKASMPGGQMAVDRYKDDSDVEFYFIDTNETSADYRAKVADFIKSKGYTFSVLFDNGEPGHQDTVYKDYCSQLKTSGIPFKLIIDGKGHLRWSMCGYHGSPSGMADEIQTVIDYLKAEK